MYSSVKKHLLTYRFKKDQYSRTNVGRNKTRKEQTKEGRNNGSMEEERMDQKVGKLVNKDERMARRRNILQKERWKYGQKL